MRLTSPPWRAECHGIWEPKPPGTLWATPGLLRDCFTLCDSPKPSNKNIPDWGGIVEEHKLFLKRCTERFRSDRKNLTIGMGSEE